MKALGFNIGNGTLRWALVGGTVGEPKMIVCGKGDYDPKETMTKRMSAIRDHFEGALKTHEPDRVAYRMHMGRGLTQEQIATFHYPWGVLLLCCPALPVIEVTGSSLTFKRFGLEKGTKPMEAVDGVLGRHPPHWDDAQRYAACAAWAALA